jgi:hypothetical protein
VAAHIHYTHTRAHLSTRFPHFWSTSITQCSVVGTKDLAGMDRYTAAAQLTDVLTCISTRRTPVQKTPHLHLAFPSPAPSHSPAASPSALSSHRILEIGPLHLHLTRHHGLLELSYPSSLFITQAHFIWVDAWNFPMIPFVSHLTEQ